MKATPRRSVLAAMALSSACAPEPVPSWSPSPLDASSPLDARGSLGAEDVGSRDAREVVGDARVPADAVVVPADAVAVPADVVVVPADVVAVAMDAGPRCVEPDGRWVDGACVPSCGGAGGNTCAAAGSTLCVALPTLRAHDCAVCCRRPAPRPAAEPLSFHVVHRDHPAHWDAIAALAQQRPAVTIASQNRPATVAPERWARMIHTSTQPDGASLARSLNAALVADDAPRVVMVDELNDGTVTIIRDLADAMSARYPQWRGRWGAFTTVFTDGLPAIDALLRAGAYIAAERYIDQDWYCRQGDNGGERDIALARFFDGDAALARYHWLVARREALRSASVLSVVFGVTDRYMNGANPAVFLDRMFYVWATRTRHPEALDLARGGVGAWKWDPNAPPGGFGTSNTSRDLSFAESARWYGERGMRTSRLGPVACP